MTNFCQTDKIRGNDTKEGEEEPDEFLASLREATTLCEFGELTTVADPEAFLIQVRFIAGL